MLDTESFFGLGKFAGSHFEPNWNKKKTKKAQWTCLAGESDDAGALPFLEPAWGPVAIVGPTSTRLNATG